MDPGHGWVKVPIQLLMELDIFSKISTYSYRNGDFAYLEEDMDAGTFIEAYKAKFDDAPKFREHFTDRSSRIRNYQSFR